MPGPTLNELDERSRVFGDPLEPGLRIPRLTLPPPAKTTTLRAPRLRDQFETIFEGKGGF